MKKYTENDFAKYLRELKEADEKYEELAVLDQKGGTIATIEKEEE